MSVTPSSRPVLIAYDGSDHAKHAITGAAEVLGGGPAVVVTAWTTFRDAAPSALLAMPGGVVAQAAADIDEATRANAADVSAEGAQLARAAGFSATAHAAGGSGPYFRVLLDAAAEHEARAIVVGSRGRSALAATVLGSVSTGVLHHGRLPVLVIPVSSGP